MKIWQTAHHTFSFEKPEDTLVMGILNVTPDSFSDGGSYTTVNAALTQALRMREEGATIIDVGGESTRPGHDVVSLDEERRRVLPMVEALLKEGLIVSVDTRKPQLMAEVARMGVDILNDVEGFASPEAREVAAQTTCGLVVMHSAHTPIVGDVVETVERELLSRSRALVEAGVAMPRLCWDPGFGFGKDAPQNLALLRATSRLARPYPYLMGLSRKRTLGLVTGEDVASRRQGSSVAGALMSAMMGASMVRVHDVKMTVDALKMWAATYAQKG